MWILSRCPLLCQTKVDTFLAVQFVLGWLQVAADVCDYGAPTIEQYHEISSVSCSLNIYRPLSSLNYWMNTLKLHNGSRIETT